jgi:negative regulator of genetic competence, sporulation and motility
MFVRNHEKIKELSKLIPIWDTSTIEKNKVIIITEYCDLTERLEGFDYDDIWYDPNKKQVHIFITLDR